MLKKLIVFVISIMVASPAFAACDFATKCATPHSECLKATQIMSNVTGASFLSENLAEFFITHELRKATGAKLKVKINAKSAKDLAAGRFQRLDITGKNVNFDGIFLSSFKENTVCDYNYIKMSGKDLVFMENFVAKYAIEMSADDLSKTMSTSDYLKTLNSVDLGGLGVTLFKIQNANVVIKNNKFYFIMDVKSPIMFNKPMHLCVGTDFKVEDGKIVFTKVYLENIYTRVDLSNLVYALNALNPMNFSLNIYKDKNAQIQVKNAQIVNNIFKVDGLVYIPKDSVIEGK